MSELAKLQRAYTLCLAHLIVWINEHPGWEVSFGEGHVALTDGKDGDHDGPHRKDGGHYRALANDMNLFIDGVLISDGDHPAWLAIHEKWRSMHPAAGSIAHDRNHIAFRYGGVL